MRLTVLVNPQTRTATFREVSFLAAGDECELLLHGVAGADTASLALVLYRDATLESPVAAVPAGSFSDVPNHRDDRAAALSLSAPEMEAWFLSAALRAQESESSESGQAGASAESAVRALGWLVVSDASRTWVAMRVPVLLRSFTPSGSPVDGSTVAASVMAAVREALAGKADAVPGKGLSSNDFTDALLARLESVSAGAEPNVQADWAVEASSDDAFIKNRPSIPPAPVQADWGCEDSSDPSFVRRKPDLSGIGARPKPDWLAESSADDGIVHKPDLSAFARVDSLPRADWAETDPSSPSYVANKPVRAVPDWDESDSADPSFIRNRPDLSRFVRLSSFPQADWSEDDASKPSYVRNRPRRVRPDWLAAESDAAGILNKPEIPPPQEQADWWETSVGSPSYVRHKPQVDQAVSAASPSANAASSKAVVDYVAAAVSGLQEAVPGWRFAYWDGKQDALSAARMARWDAAAYASSASAGPWPMVPAEFSGTSLPVSPSECALAAWPSGASAVSVSVLSAGESSDSSDSSSDSGLPPSRRLLVALDCSGAEGPLSVSWPAGSLPSSSDAEPGTVNVWRLDEFAAGRFAVHRLHPPAKGQAQADWDEEDSSDPSFVRNRPYVPPVVSDVDLCSSEDMWPDGVPTVGLVAEHLAHKRSLADLAAYAEAGPSWQLVSGLPDGYSAPDGPYDDGYAGDGVNHLWKLDMVDSGPGVSLSAFGPADASELVFHGLVGEETVYVTYRRSPGGFSPTGDRLALRSEVAQADWGESDSSDPSFVRNRPDLSLKRDVSDLSYPGEYADWTDSYGATYKWDASLRKWTKDPSWTGQSWTVAALWYSGGKWRFDRFAVGEEAPDWAESGSEGDLATSPAGTLDQYRPAFTRPSVYAREPGTLALLSDLAQADWDESSSGDPSFIRNRPRIDEALAERGAAADAKAVGDALRGGFTEWVCDEVTEGYEFVSCKWEKDSVGPDYYWRIRFLNTMLPNPVPVSIGVNGVAEDAMSLSATGTTPSFSLSRHLITPTKTSQLTNDSGFLTSSDLPYALVAKTPADGTVTLSDRAVNLVNPTVTATTEWTWADGETGTPVFSNGYWTLQNASFDTYDGPVAGSASDTEITFAKTDTKSFYYSTTDYDYETGEQVFVFNVGGEGGEEVRAKSKWSDNYYENIVESVEYDGVEYALESPATENSTGNTYSGTGTVVEHVVSLVTTYGPMVTLTMPQAVPGRVRDLIARIDLSQAAGAPPVVFSGGTFEAVDGEMPELVKGVNLLSFTETASGVLAVAYKEVKLIAQGGS